MLCLQISDIQGKISLKPYPNLYKEQLMDLNSFMLRYMLSESGNRYYPWLPAHSLSLTDSDKE